MANLDANARDAVTSLTELVPRDVRPALAIALSALDRFKDFPARSWRYRVATPTCARSSCRSKPSQRSLPPAMRASRAARPA
jgi:hypothetical protein